MKRHGPTLLGFILLLQGCSTAVTLAPVTEQGDHPHVTASRHLVSSGDTLYSIAWQYGLDYRDIARFNGIRPPYLIHKGQILRLRPRAGKRGTTVAGRKTAGNRVLVKTNRPVVVTRSSRTSPRPPRAKPGPAVVRSHKVIKPAPARPRVASGSVPRYDARNWKWPVKGKLLMSYSSKGGGRKGIQIGGRRGQPIVAANSGKVVYSGSGLRGYGRLVIIKHNATYLSAYGQNERVMVKQGDQIRAGQQIATMGNQHGSHAALYFEMRRNGKPINPLRVLPKRH